MELLIIGGAIAILAGLAQKATPGEAKAPKTVEEAGLPPGTYRFKDTVISKTNNDVPPEWNHSTQPVTGVSLPPSYLPTETQDIIKVKKVSKDLTISAVSATDDYYKGEVSFKKKMTQ